MTTATMDKEQSLWNTYERYRREGRDTAYLERQLAAIQIPRRQQFQRLVVRKQMELMSQSPSTKNNAIGDALCQAMHFTRTESVADPDQERATLAQHAAACDLQWTWED